MRAHATIRRKPKSSLTERWSLAILILKLIRIVLPEKAALLHHKQRVYPRV